jgi:tetratricopeptide (TPR) repeat protein
VVAAAALASVEVRAIAGRPQRSGATADLESAARRRPGDARAGTRLVERYLSQARLTGEGTWHRRAREVVEAMRRAEPTSPVVLGLSAWIHVGEHRFDEAVAEARRALAAWPHDASAAGALSDALLELGRYDEAAAAVQVLLDSRPGPAGYSRAAHLRALHGDLQGSMEMIDRAVESASPAAHDPEMAAWLAVQRGDLRAMQGDARGAHAAYDAALHHVDGFHAAVGPLARLLARQGRLDEAARLLAAALRRRPAPDLAATLEDVERARGRAREAELAAGVVDSLAVLALASGAGGPAAGADRGIARADADHRRNLDRALSMARAEHRVRPDIVSADVLGWVLLRRGQPADALAFCAQALRLGTPDPLLEAHHALALRAAGRVAQARPIARRALDRGVTLDLCLVGELERLLAR